MHYTINKIVLLKNDKSQSLNISDYKTNTVIGDELISFLTGHLNGESWQLGITTALGPHSFLLAMNPTLDILRFWKAAKQGNWFVKIGCGGDLEVVDNKGETRFPPKPNNIHPIAKKPIPRQSMNSFIEKRIKRLYK